MTFDALDTNAVLETSECAAFAPIEMHSDDQIARSIDKMAGGFGNQLFARETAKTLAGTVSAAPKWLPFASESYEISSDIRDYIMVPVVIAPSDIPNRNKTAFPFVELSRWSPQAGKLTYETWQGKPTHIDHINRDWRKAKGVVMDVSMSQMPGRAGKPWKVIALCGFDRGKDAALANDILTGTRSTYSMGAMVSYYSCSVCGSCAEHGSGKKLPCGNRHVSQHGPFKTFSVDGQQVLAHYNAHDFVGFEVSSVTLPAWASAATDPSSHVSY